MQGRAVDGPLEPGMGSAMGSSGGTGATRGAALTSRGVLTAEDPSAGIPSPAVCADGEGWQSA